MSSTQYYVLNDSSASHGTNLWPLYTCPASDKCLVHSIMCWMIAPQVMAQTYGLFAQVLLPAANLLQLTDVRDACCDFLKAQLHPTNCLGIRAFADMHSCPNLLVSAHSFAEQHFGDVIVGEEFLALSNTQVIGLISSDQLTVPTEEKVSILWVIFQFLVLPPSTCTVCTLYSAFWKRFWRVGLFGGRNRLCDSQLQVTVILVSVGFLRGVGQRFWGGNLASLRLWENWV